MTMNSESFPSREEAIDFGKDYEYLMAAYYSLLLSFEEEIPNFRISTNNNDMGDFDDVVIECNLKGEEHIFAIQLKHVVRPIAQVTLITDNKKFSLKKYSKEFQKVKTSYTKLRSYTAPFENIHFILFSNSTLEKFEEFNTEWKKLEPVANKKKIESDIFIRRTKCFEEKLLSVSQTNENFLFEFKSEMADSADAQFFKQFSFFTKQKDAKQMESSIAEFILKKFKCSDPNVVVNVLNYFNYWCRRDFGTFKLTKEDVRFKLAELVLTQYIPDPDFTTMEYFSDAKIALLYQLFLKFDVVLVDDQSDETMNAIWGILLKQLASLSQNWAKPLSGIYINTVQTQFQIPISALSENFSEVSLKKLYVLMWHAGRIPLVVNLNSLNREDIILAIKLSESSDNMKKFVVIDQDNCFPRNCKWTTFKNLADVYNFTEFYDPLSEILVISIQGRSSITFKELMLDEKAWLKQFSTKEVLLMKEDSFTVGKREFSLPKYYIPRLIPKVLLDIKAVDEVSQDLFIIITSDDRNDKFNSEQKVCDNIIFAKDGCSHYQFHNFCFMNPEKNCHVVNVVDEDRIEWIQSRFSLENLRKYRLDHKDFKPKDFVNDEDVFTHFDNKINIICAESGMGKSMMMIFLTSNCPSDYWTIKITLGEHINFFKQEHTIEETLEYFLKTKFQTSLVQTFLNILSSKKKIMFFWDGLDEVSKHQLNIVINTIKSLAGDGFPQWLAARMSLRKFLENTFNTFVLTLTEFSEQNQYDYIHNNLKEKYECEDKVQEVIELVRTSISTSLNCAYFNYTRIPLYLHMTLEIYLQTNKDLNSAIIITLTDIYQQFIEGKFDNLFKAANADSDNQYMEQIREDYKNAQLTMYEKAAVKASFEDVKIDCDELFHDLKEGADSLGLIVGITDNKPIFAHKTYEEFLAASWLAKNCRLRQELVKILFKEEYINVRLMFDMLMAKDAPLILGVLYRNINVIKLYFDEVKCCKDRGGRNALHIACSWGQKGFNVNVGEVWQQYFAKEEVAISWIKKQEKDEDDDEEESTFLEILKFLLDNGCSVFETDALLNWNVLQYAEHCYNYKK